VLIARPGCGSDGSKAGQADSLAPSRALAPLTDAQRGHFTGGSIENRLRLAQTGDPFAT